MSLLVRARLGYARTNRRRASLPLPERRHERSNSGYERCQTCRKAADSFKIPQMRRPMIPAALGSPKRTW